MTIQALFISDSRQRPSRGAGLFSENCSMLSGKTSTKQRVCYFYDADIGNYCEQGPNLTKTC